MNDITESAKIAPTRWIGWNQLITNTPKKKGKNCTVEIVFEFSDIRKFTQLEIWSYGISLRTTEIFFRPNGKKFALASQISSIQRRPLDATRNLPIRLLLHNVTGQTKLNDAHLMNASKI
ncbi:unnamed protein product [Wuchereria bancrofti]|uniref:Uncharacterized protein n=1 Tax=Wuchereria bancrofti TaxID=6293 RepID=A0A3P7EA13_WUCBA|nr:unnamed protein product [Wuchereria bancrofti]